MSPWEEMLWEQSADLELVCQYAEVVIKDPALTLEQAVTLVKQATKGRAALATFIDHIEKAGPVSLVERSRKLDAVWTALEQAALARLKIIETLENASPDGIG